MTRVPTGWAGSTCEGNMTSGGFGVYRVMDICVEWGFIQIVHINCPKRRMGQGGFGKTGYMEAYGGNDEHGRHSRMEENEGTGHWGHI